MWIGITPTYNVQHNKRSRYSKVTECINCTGLHLNQITGYKQYIFPLSNHSEDVNIDAWKMLLALFPYT